MTYEQQEHLDKTAAVEKGSQDNPPQPPQAPDITPRFKLYSYQIIGIPLLMLVPILALLGVFGRSHDTLQQETDTIAVTVEYPTRYRFKQIDAIDVRIANTSGTPLAAVRVRFERDYINCFSTVTFTPMVKIITEEYYEVELTDIPAGETRYISVELQAEDAGRHTGTIVIEPDTGEGVELSLTTILFP